MNIEERALELKRLRQQADEYLSAGHIELWLEVVHEQCGAIEQLQRALLSQSVHVVRSPAATKILREIDLTDVEELERFGKELLYSWFSPRDYALGLSRVNALISPIPVSPSLRDFVDEARQCCAFGQSNAVYSLSRTILEAAVNDLCIRTKYMPKYVLDEDLFNDERYTFSRRLSHLSSGDRYTRIYGHYKLLCRVIHGATTVSCGEAVTALAETLGFIHELYAIN